MDMQAYMYKKRQENWRDLTPPMAIFLFRIQEWTRE